jgi:GntR family transcriptional regulator of arabinose operon
MKKQLMIALLSIAPALGVVAQDKLYKDEFPLGDITLLDGPLKHARDLNVQVLLKYDCDRMLAPYRKEAGLQPRKPYYPELEAPHVSLNDAEAAYKAVRYLIDKGHQKIGAILKLDDGQGRQRYLGYLKAMEEAGLTVTDSRMVWIDTDESKQLGYCRDRILNRVEECTALLAYNDQIAFQLIRMLTERNIRVPEDVSVISIDDSDLARHSEVPITSLPHPKENLGKKAAETLLQMIAGRKKNLTYEFDTRVVERESVAECTENGNKK